MSHDRRSVRLPAWDYREYGAYFVTVCTADRACILDDPAIRTALEHAWRAIGKYARGVRGDDFVVMPNHVHGIIWLPGTRGVDTRATVVGARHVRPPILVRSADVELERRSSLVRGRASPLRPDLAPQPEGAPKGSLGAVVGAFKSASARRINALRRTRGAPVWQRGYHERIIRDDCELMTKREYIRDNPAEWAEDPNNPAVYAREISTFAMGESASKSVVTAPPS